MFIIQDETLFGFFSEVFQEMYEVYLLSVWGTDIGCGPFAQPNRLNHLSTATNTLW